MLAALLAVALAQQTPHIEAPSHVFVGPTRLCGYYFSLSVPAGAQVRWEGNIDFDIYQVEGTDGRWAFYEGFAPDADGAGRETVILPNGQQVRRLERDGSFDYLIQTVSDPHPYYLHVFGESLRGDAVDIARLGHFTFGSAAQTGCRQPSSETYREQWMRGLDNNR